MDLAQYEEKVDRTLKRITIGLSPEECNYLHMLLGMATEASELLDIYKAYVAYGKTIDPVHMQEELGDLLYFVQGYCIFAGLSLSEILDQNIHKLEVRYPEKFTDHAATHRDLVKERKVLEFTSQISLQNPDLMYEYRCAKCYKKLADLNEVCDCERLERGDIDASK